jgi:hypothetical protein
MFLQRLDKLSKSLAENSGLAESVARDLDSMSTKDDLLLKGEYYRLIKRIVDDTGDEHRHFLNHWLSGTDYFPNVPAAQRVGILLKAMKEVAHLVWCLQVPVSSSWDCSAPHDSQTFGYTIEISDQQITVTFVTPGWKGGSVPADQEWEEDESTFGVFWDGTSEDEAVGARRISGVRQK